MRPCEGCRQPVSVLWRVKFYGGRPDAELCADCRDLFRKVSSETLGVFKEAVTLLREKAQEVKK